MNTTMNEPQPVRRDLDARSGSTRKGRRAKPERSPSEQATLVGELIEAFKERTVLWCQLEKDLRNAERGEPGVRPDIRRLHAVENRGPQVVDDLLAVRIDLLSREFLWFGDEYATREGITHDAFVAAGLPPELLSEAGIERPNRRSRNRSSQSMRKSVP